MLRTILNNKPLLWLVLALPAIGMIRALVIGDTGVFGDNTGAVDAADLLHPSGEFSARLMIAAMMLGPLLALIGPRPWLAWLVARRRSLGVAAFGYALLHLLLYCLDMGNLDDMLAELSAPGIWTGWAAFALMLPLAASSNDAAVRALKAGWKRLQRLAYPAAILTLLHWALVHNNATAALIHFAPLVLLHLLRLVRFSRPSLQGIRK